MSELEQVTDYKPIVFADQKPMLTYAQNLIYKLLVQRAEENEPVIKQDIDYIFAIYQSHDHQGSRFVWIRCWYKGEFIRRRFTIEQAQTKSYITDRSMPWFKHNLASCIIKGKLIAIPVINES